MVWDNPFELSQSISSALKPKALGSNHLEQPRAQAAIGDRLLSWILDVLLVFPFINLFLFKFLQQYRDADWVFEPLGTSWWLSKIIYGVYVFILFTVVQAIFWSWRHQTMGQMFFRLTVKTCDPNNKLSFNRALLRALMLNLSVLFLGIPLVAMLSHKQKLAFHDLISETWVESVQRSWSVAQTWPRVAALVRSFYSLIAGGVFIFLFIFVSTLEQILDSNRQELASVEESPILALNKECDSLGQGTNEWDGLFSAYLSGKIDIKCLNQMTSEEPNKDSMLSVYLFAKYLQFEAETPLRERYKQNACLANPREGACQWIELREKNSQISQPFKAADFAFEWLLQYQYALYYSDRSLMNKLIKQPMPYHSASMARGHYEWIKLGSDRDKVQMLLSELNITMTDNKTNQLICQWDQVYHCQASHPFTECQSYFSSQYPQGSITSLEDQWLFLGYQTCQGHFASAIKRLQPIKHLGLNLLSKQILNDQSSIEADQFAKIFAPNLYSSNLRSKLVKIWQPLLLKSSSLDRGLASEAEKDQ